MSTTSKSTTNKSMASKGTKNRNRTAKKNRNRHSISNLSHRLSADTRRDDNNDNPDVTSHDGTVITNPRKRGRTNGHLKTSREATAVQNEGGQESCRSADSLPRPTKASNCTNEVHRNAMRLNHNDVSHPGNGESDCAKLGKACKIDGRTKSGVIDSLSHQDAISNVSSRSRKGKWSVKKTDSNASSGLDNEKPLSTDHLSSLSLAPPEPSPSPLHDTSLGLSSPFSSFASAAMVVENSITPSSSSFSFPPFSQLPSLSSPTPLSPTSSSSTTSLTWSTPNSSSPGIALVTPESSSTMITSSFPLKFPLVRFNSYGSNADSISNDDDDDDDDEVYYGDYSHDGYARLMYDMENGYYSFRTCPPEVDPYDDSNSLPSAMRNGSEGGEEGEESEGERRSGSERRESEGEGYERVG
eukprot:CAMPEP_0175070578 /NCGR_PEP_ID=MMETSP0052_2-20121109/18789_1 /TAXON_ID=51329 ORGANISM="Polytomella parva, Strain SAG 63-3" /NCGR_SAMPLE_ID=MMETSP0052_2 /ASSEMBLY_ACC=CAM_ASM_000194 /LENGTH=412 /DNA_ID=CAMNT_0016337701 /DNA_START=115 /DNA_END=1350 /DNA_ORIENTATION=+